MLAENKNKIAVTLNMSELSILNGAIPGSIKLDRVITSSLNYHYDIEKGAMSQTLREANAQSNSNSNVQFQISTEGDKLFLDRKIMTRWSMRFTMTGTPLAGSPLLFPGGTLGGRAALRWMPIQSCCSTVRMVINGTAITFRPAEYLEPYDRYSGDPFFNNLDMSVGPSVHDRYQQYSDGFQTNINVLGDYFTSNTPEPRGAFDYVIESDAGGVAVIVATWYEPLMMSPLIFGKYNDKGFYGLVSDTMIEMNFQNLNRIWSIDQVNGPTISSIGVAYAEIPRVIYRWLESPIAPDLSIPQLYPYTEFNLFTTPGGAPLAAGASSSRTAQNAVLGVIPTTMLVYLRERDGDRNWAGTDTYARIDKINITFDNNPGILAAAPTASLYRIACQNGLKDVSWNGWNKYVGSPLLLNFSRDIPLKQLNAVGQLGRFNINFTVDFTNTSDRAINYDLYAVFATEGVFTLVNGGSHLDVGLISADGLTMAAVQESEFRPDVNFHDDFAFFEGGSFMDKAKRLQSFARSAVQKGKDIYDTAKPFVEAAIPYIRKYGPDAARAIGTFAPLLLGLGFDEDAVYDMMVTDGKFSPMELRAAGLTGGGLTGGSRSAPSRPKNVRSAATIMAMRRK